MGAGDLSPWASVDAVSTLDGEGFSKSDSESEETEGDSGGEAMLSSSTYVNTVFSFYSAGSIDYSIAAVDESVGVVVQDGIHRWAVVLLMLNKTLITQCLPELLEEISPVAVASFPRRWVSLDET